MEPALKLYVLGMFIRTNGQGTSYAGLDAGEFPFEAFYRNILGRDVDLEEEGYEEVEGMRDYLLAYPLTKEKLDNVTALGFSIGSSAHEKVIAPYWEFDDDDSCIVYSLEGIEALENLRWMNLERIAKTCSLEPLTRLRHLEEIEGITLRADFTPLLKLEGLRKFSPGEGWIKEEEFAGNLAVIKQLKEKGVEVDDSKLTVEPRRFF